MACTLSLDEILFLIEWEDAEEGKNDATIALKTIASGSKPRYQVSAIVDLGNTSVKSQMRYDSDKKIFLDSPDGLRMLNLADEIKKQVMEKMSSVYSQLADIGYVQFKES